MRKFYIVGFALLLLFDTLGQSSFKLTAIHDILFQTGGQNLLPDVRHILLQSFL